MESAQATTARAVSNDASIDHDQRMLIEAIKHEIGASDDVTVLAQFAEKMGLVLPRSEPAPDADSPDDGIPQTEQAQIKTIGRLVVEAVKGILGVQGIYGKRPDYGDHIERVTHQVNRMARCRAEDCRTIEQAQSRLDAARRLLESVQ